MKKNVKVSSKHTRFQKSTVLIFLYASEEERNLNVL